MITLLVIYIVAVQLVILLWMAFLLLSEYWQQKRREKERLQRQCNDLKLYRPSYHVEEE